MVQRIFLYLFFLMLGYCPTLMAQSNYKEGANSFARFTKTNDIKQLESAKKFIDAGYKTKRDSSIVKNNVLRAMIYSSLAYVDSNRTIKSDKDPIIIAREALNRLRPRDKNKYTSELNYITQNLTAAYIYKANKELAAKKFDDAYQSYLEVNQLGTNTNEVTYNLALLASQANKIEPAIVYYNTLIKDTDASAAKYLELADLYKRKGDMQAYLTTLESSKAKFTGNKQIIFQLVDIYSANKSYGSIVGIIDEALAFDPENNQLIYLAGFANENMGNINQAKIYYQRLIEVDHNNYNANLALGLVFLNDFLQNNENLEVQYNAQNYLLKANEIKPYDISALKGLAMYYKASGDDNQLDRVNLLLNQLSNN